MDTNFDILSLKSETKNFSLDNLNLVHFIPKLVFFNPFTPGTPQGG